MEKHFTLIGLAVLVVAGGFYAGFTSDAPQEPVPEARSESGFNMDSGPALRRAPRAEEPLRDAVASPAPALPAAAVKPAPAAFAAPVVGSEGWVKGQAMYLAMMAAPVDFIVKKTLLAKGEAFIKFARDPVRVNRYLTHPLICGVIDSPALLRGLLGSQAVVAGFLRSPAMQDPRAVAALAASPLLRRLEADPSVQKVLADPAVINGIVTNPEAIGWLMSHPEGMTAFLRASPAALSALGPMAKLRR